MQNMKSYFLYILSVLTMLTVVSCQRDDDEPIKAKKPISRLYISTSDYRANTTTTPLRNIFVVAPADSATFAIDAVNRFTSSAKGGSAIHFSPFSRSIFQSSMNFTAYRDTAVYVMTVSDKGVVSAGNVIGNRRFNNVKGLWYYVHNRPGSGSTVVGDNYLLMTNLGDTVNLFVVERPLNLSNYAPIRHELELNYSPWAIQMDSADLLLSKTGNNGGVVVYKNLASSFGRDTVLTIQPSYELTVEGANNIRGISYSRADDILVLTDFTAPAVGDPAVGDGRILVFDNFSKYKATATIVPTRIISGVLTKLQEPLDVALDVRKDGKFIYVADAGSTTKSVLRFKIGDEGNVKPDQELSVNGQTPQSLSLDSRGPSRD